MLRQEIQHIIIQHLKKFNPEYIGIFGSYIRGENNINSDLDILVRFKDVLSLLQLIKLENELSEEIGIKVDLITEGALKNNRIKNSIKKDLKMIYKA